MADPAQGVGIAGAMDYQPARTGEPTCATCGAVIGDQGKQRPVARAVAGLGIIHACGDLCAQASAFRDAASPEVVALRDENEQLRLALLGGEDAPGLAASIPHAELLQIARKGMADTWGYIDHLHDRRRAISTLLRGMTRRVLVLRARVARLEAALPTVQKENIDHVCAAPSAYPGS